MKSLRELYRIGLGPSSSHTMGPRFAALAFSARVATSADAASVRVHLHGSLAATGRGHLTDRAVSEPFAPLPVELAWHANELPLHPNGLRFEALADDGTAVFEETWYSVGGGALMDADGKLEGGPAAYPYASMAEVIAASDSGGKALWEFVAEHEGPEIWDWLRAVWQAMKAAIGRGLEAEGVLPGPLHLQRKASAYHTKASTQGGLFNATGLIFAYALAVSEENAAGHTIVTAPTCGASGVLPAVLYFLQKQYDFSDDKILRALATAGLVGNLVKRNASISGAEVGCQGEVGVACAMAAAAAAQLLGASVRQVEYAAEMGLEHHLGLTCDPIGGYVQIPCIERNAIAAVRAVDCAAYVLSSDGRHVVSFDEVVQTMYETGRDMKSGYRETAAGGLAKIHRARHGIGTLPQD